MDSSLAVAFAGTPAFALPALDAIAASRHRLVVVYTRPDRPAGRGRRVTASPVKLRAQSLSLPVEQPETLRESTARERLARHAPDVMVVVAYGVLLPQAILDLPRFGCLNIHASLLPRWRGAAPVARAILAGDTTTGVSIMRMEAGLDSGPVMLRRALATGPRETAGELQDRLAAVGGALIVEALDALVAGRASCAAQDPAQATWARKLEKSEARVDWREPAAALERRVRALIPWPVAETQLEGLQLRLWQAAVVAAAPGPAPGTIIGVGAEGITVMTGSGALLIERLQLPGRRPVAAGDFAHTRRLLGLTLG